MKYYDYQPGNGTKYILWTGELEGPYESQSFNALIWNNPDKGTNTIFTFPKSRSARVTDITDKLEGGHTFLGDVAAITGFAKCEMGLTVHDPEGVLHGYDELGRWVG